MGRAKGPFDCRIALHLSQDGPVWSVGGMLNDDQRIAGVEKAGIVFMEGGLGNGFRELRALLTF